MRRCAKVYYRKFERSMSLKDRAVLVIVNGMVLGLSLYVGGGLIGNGKAPEKE